MDNIFAAGDGCFVDGAVPAALKGELTALAIAADMEMIHGAERDKQGREIIKELERELAPRPFIDALYRLPQKLYDTPEDTTICRCECITKAQILDAINEGCIDPNEIKALLRPGMGPCQGKMCQNAISELISIHAGIDIKEVGSLNIRPPLKNVPLSEIAEIELMD